MKTLQNRLESQHGVMLIEALVGILIFAIGILALIGLQGAAISATTESKLRSDAAYLTQKIVTTIWSQTAADVPSFDTSSGSNAKMLAWKTEVANALPLATGGNAPTISVVSVDGGFNVTVTVFWAKPGNEASAGSPQQHKHTTFTRIDFN